MTDKNITPRRLKSFSPLDGLKQDNLEALVRKTRLKSLPAGDTLFEAGDDEKVTLYLLSGQVELVNQQDKVVKSITADSLGGPSSIGAGPAAQS